MVSPNSAVPRAVAPSPGKRAHGHRPVRIRQPLRLVDVRTIPAEALLGADFRHPAIVEATELFARADGVVVGTPVYKAPYSGVLKALLDLLPQYTLAGKTVLPLATGGSVPRSAAPRCWPWRADTAATSTASNGPL
jgi:hypothetical protein